MGQFGIIVPGGVEHAGLRAKALNETGNRLVLTDCPNAFHTVLNGGASRGDQLCVSAHAVCGQVLWHKTR